MLWNVVKGVWNLLCLAVVLIVAYIILQEMIMEMLHPLKSEDLFDAP
jgi:hypothetical protein